MAVHSSATPAVTTPPDPGGRRQRHGLGAWLAPERVFRLLPFVLVEVPLHKTKTQQGLAVTVRVLDTLYETGRKVSDAFKQHMPIVFDTVLPKWNYWAVPQ